MDYRTFLNTVRDTETPWGTARLWWLGQMGLIVKLGGTVLSIDYYATADADRQVPPPIPAEALTGVDAFLGTHDHIDHIDHPAWKIWAKTCPEARFVAPRFCLEPLLADGHAPERLVGLNDGESCRIGDVTVRAFAAAHEFLDRDEASGLYPCLQYVLEGNGVRLYHAGDTVRYEGMLPKLQAVGPIDAGLMPINGRDGKRYRNNIIGNMTWQESADLAGELGVGLAIPGHWDMFAFNSADPNLFADFLDVKYEGRVKCVVPKYLEGIEVRRG